MMKEEEYVGKGGTEEEKEDEKNDEEKQEEQGHEEDLVRHPLNSFRIALTC